MAHDLTHYAAVVSAWAAEHAAINRAWIFGSYAKGTAHADSDLDVAVEVSLAHCGEPSMQLFWYRRESELSDSLRKKLDVKLDLRLYHRFLAPETYGYVQELKRAPVYKRARSSRPLRT